LVSRRSRGAFEASSLHHFSSSAGRELWKIGERNEEKNIFLPHKKKRNGARIYSISSARIASKRARFNAHSLFRSEEEEELAERKIIMDDDDDDDDDANENKSLLEAHASFFQSACEKKRRRTEKNRIEFTSFDASANVLVLKIHRVAVAATGDGVVSFEGNEAKSEEEGELTLMFPVSLIRLL
jgi:NAD-dependent SIR2 family protein deacetylase